ncbi:MAG: 30S ribosomal protein S16, partial [Pedosphaera sp.]|nr:30S ribosomal protein S16 [Pedosphaera sp.]
RNNFTLKLDRVDYWLGVGAQPSDTVASFIRKARKGPVEEVDEEPVVEAVEAPAAPESVPEPKVAVTEETAAEEPAAEETPAPEAEVATETSAPKETPEPEAPTAAEAEAPKADD